MLLLRHLTNAKIMGTFVQSQQDAWMHFDKPINDPRAVFLSEPATVEVAFRGFTQSTAPAQGIWTDAYLAALAVEHNAQIVMFDQGFSRFAKLDLFVVVGGLAEKA